MSCSKRMTMFV